MSAAQLPLDLCYEFDIQPEHWDALLREYCDTDIEMGRIAVELAGSRDEMRGNLVALLERPRVRVDVLERVAVI